MILFFKFPDPVLFRTNMPFDAGIHRRATSFFPPTPSTMQGAIRSKIILESGISFQEWMKFLEKEDASIESNSKLPQLKEKIGDSNSLGKLTLKGPFVASKIDGEVKVYFSVPLDVVAERKKKSLGKIFILKPLTNNPLGNGYSLKYSDAQQHSIPKLLWLKTDKKIEALENSFMSIDAFGRYLLSEEFLPGDIINGKDIYGTERRAGIWRENKRVKEGMLYYADFVRLKENFGLVEDVRYENTEELPLKNDGTVALGGQGKAAYYESLSRDPFEVIFKLKDKVIRKTKETNSLKIVFVTPAFFENPLKVIEDNSLEFVTASIGKPTTIGGWNFAQNSPKEARKYIPAGSVYYFKIKDKEKIEKIFDRYWFKSILEGQFSKFGYGITLLGIW